MKLTKYGTKLLCLFILATIIPLGIAGMVIYKHVYDRTEDGVYSQLRVAGLNLNIQLNLLLAKKRVRVVDFSSDGYIRDSVEHMIRASHESPKIGEMLNSHLIINKKSLDSSITDIEILDTRGKVLASTYINDIDKDKSHEDFFRVPFVSSEGRGSYFVDSNEGTNTADKLQLVFSVLLKDKIMQSPLGVIAIKVKGDILKDLFDHHIHHIHHIDQHDENGLPTPFSTIYIVNRYGKLIVNSDSFKFVDFNRTIDTKIFKEALTSKKNISGIYKNYKGVQVLGTALFVPETNWVILAEKNIDEAFLPLVHVRDIFLISGGGVLFLVTIFAFIISNDTNNIIKKLLKGFKRVETGDFGHKIVINKWDERQQLAISFNSMTQKLKASKVLENKLNEIKMLNSLTEKINMGLTLEEVFSYVYEHFKSIIPYDRIGIAFLTDNGATVQARWARTEAKEAYLTKEFSVKLEESSLNDVILSGKPRIISDMREYLKAKPQSAATELMVKEGMISSLNCPLFALGKPIGFMFFSSFKVNAYSDVHVEFFSQIAGELALIIEKSRLYQTLENKLNEIKMLNSLTERVNMGFTLEEVLSYVYDSFRTIIPYDRIGLAYLVNNGKTVEHKWTRSESKEIKLDNEYSVKLEETTLDSIVRSKKSRIINDLEEYLKEYPQSDSTKRIVEEGMRSSLTCPLVISGRPIGFIFFSSFNANIYLNIHVEFLTQITGQLSVIVEKSRLFQERLQLERNSTQIQMEDERNRTLAQMVVGVAHEINTPLGITNTAASVIKRELASEKMISLAKERKVSDILETVFEAVELMQRNISRADTLIQSFKHVSVSQIADTIEKMNMSEVIAEEVDLFKIEARKAKLEIEVRDSLTDQSREWIGYRGYLSRIILNLLTNAKRYAYSESTGGKIVIFVAADNKRKEPCFTITVQDFGRGIDPENLPKVFDHFFTTGRDKGGSGLGLAVVYNLVTSALNGTIKIGSELDKGTTIFVTFPQTISK